MTIRDAGTATALVFHDPASIALRDRLDLLAPTEATILVVGETGTGKELVARYIHAHSARRGRPFVAVNCGALSDSLAEAELFGHEKGAFTGAVVAKAGWFEAAGGGTLLLDEVGDLSLPLQVKLLRVLQEREVVRLGARTTIPVDVRVIAATNVDLEKAVAEKRFREDLYFRLNVAAVDLLPLRERIGDIEPLARHFLDIYRRQLGKPDIGFAADAIAALQRHRWPGNIRELENVVQKALLLAGGSLVGASELHLPAMTCPVTKDQPAIETCIAALVQRAVATGEADLFERVLRTLVQTAYVGAQGNQIRTAAILGLSRNSLRTHLSHLGLVPPRGRGGATGPGPVRLGDRPLRIGFQKYGTLPLLKARRTLEGRLREAGFATTWHEYPAGPQLMGALQDGAIDFCATGEVPPVFAQAEGAPFAYVGYEPPAPAGEAIVVPRQSGIRSPRDLKGKRIALNKKSNVHYFLVCVLEASGLSVGDIELVDVAPALDDIFVIPGVDAWALWDPLLAEAIASRQMRILIDGTGLVSNRQFYLASRAFAERSGHAVEIILAQSALSGSAATRRPTESARLLGREIGIGGAVLAAAIARTTREVKQMDYFVISEQQKIADRFFALGMIPRPIKVSEALWRDPA
jgi:DNA-binding NtrC family response regulator/ABC-type nitrate/sulfonate/bicarbonate transport system substrate-binding protein